MINKLAKHLKLFYQVSLALIMISIASGMFYFWKLGFIDGTRNESLHQASFIIEQYQGKKPLQEIKNLALEENTKEAIEKVEAIEKEIEKIEQVSTSESFSDLSQDIQVVKQNIANLISFPKTSKVMNVFNEKFVKFYEFVSTNNWRTLTRVSERVLAQSQGFINKETLSKLASDIEKDLAYMEKVTENSVLDRVHKSEIASRISNLRVEINMLSEYVIKRNEFYKSLNSLEKSFNIWLESISPELALQKLSAAQIGKSYVMVLFGLLVLSSVLFILSFVVNSIHGKKAQKSLESHIENYVANNLMSHQSQEMSEFSDKFNDFTEQTSLYLNKRMSFGAIFQEALPLASILLDKNLKVIWANKFFCQEWSIDEEEINKGFVSWDYLSKMTNLGDNDPIFEALKFHVAGIFQIQVQNEGGGEIRPFEMYVSPVKYNREDRVMLFFYPLMSLQETIKDQARSIVSPIQKTISLMLNGQLDQEAKKSLSREYEIGSVAHLLNDFSELNEKIKKEKDFLLDEIEHNYSRIDFLEKTFEKFYELQHDIYNNTQTTTKELVEVKDAVIELSSAGKSFEGLYREMVQFYDETVEKYATCFKKNTGLVNLNKELCQALPRFELLKEDFKIVKTDLMDARSSLSQSLVQFIHLKKKIEDQDLREKFSHNLIRLNEDFKTLDTAANAIDKKMTSFEVILSKAELLLSGMNEKVETLNSYQDKEFVTISEKRLENFISLKVQNIEKIEDRSVEKMMAIYDTTKDNIKLLKEFMSHSNEVIEKRDAVDHENLA